MVKIGYFAFPLSEKNNRMVTHPTIIDHMASAECPTGSGRPWPYMTDALASPNSDPRRNVYLSFWYCISLSDP